MDNPYAGFDYAKAPFNALAERYLMERSFATEYMGVETRAQVLDAWVDLLLSRSEA